MNAINEAVKKAGGQTALARLVGVTQPAVRKWVIGESIPEPKHCISIERETGVIRSRLRSDWKLHWPEFVESSHE